MDEHCVELELTVRHGVRVDQGVALAHYADVTHRHICATPLEDARRALTLEAIHATTILLSDALEGMHAAPTLALAHQHAERFLQRLRGAVY